MDTGWKKPEAYLKQGGLQGWEFIDIVNFMSWEAEELYVVTLTECRYKFFINSNYTNEFILF